MLNVQGGFDGPDLGRVAGDSGCASIWVQRVWT